MKVLRPGSIQKLKPWVNRQWECPYCGRVVELTLSDEDDIRYGDDQRDGEFVELTCAMCGVHRHHHPVKNPLPDPLPSYDPRDR